MEYYENEVKSRNYNIFISDLRSICYIQNRNSFTSEKFFCGTYGLYDIVARQKLNMGNGQNSLFWKSDVYWRVFNDRNFLEINM